ncbi:gll1123 [Gloeobacter violaceus PCC 7421]|uniref:Gll1123 protein n=2 Tax=Gloeobacter violaceus TaxID=33072 RepID=Q7NLK0_GLOVI|nr:gll1123 [Gloeobacter violaceus PCC 7421]
MPSIAIIGGGLAGLQAAYQLKKLGLYADVYEAKSFVGGRIQSRKNVVGPGLVVELGGTFINSNHRDILTLAQEFNLPLFNRAKDAQQFPFPETGYYFDGQNRLESEVAEKLRPLADQIAKDAALLDENFDKFAPQFDRLSVAEYLNIHADKIPEPFIRTLIENSIRTEYGVEPVDSSALQLLFNLPVVDGEAVEVLGSSDEIFVVEGGSERLIASLAAVLPGRIHTRMALTRLEKMGQKYRLTFAGAQTREVDFVIVAVPVNGLKKIDFQVPLPPAFRRFIKEVSLGFNEKLFAGFSERVWRQEEGFVSEGWTDLGFSQVWEDTQRQPASSDAALTFFMGAQEVFATQSLGAQTLGEAFLQRFEAVVDGAQAAATGRFSRTRWNQDPWIGGGYTTFKPGQLTEFGGFLYIESVIPAFRQDVNFGNLIFAGEHLSDEFYGFMNGAAQTGRLAAQVVLRQIQEGQLASGKPTSAA